MMELGAMLTEEQVVSTLNSFLPAGLSTWHAPEMTPAHIAAFQADLLLAAGYRLVYVGPSDET